MTRLLASVATVEEATLVVNGGADLVDLKDPHEGALGALPVATIHTILATLDPAVVTSATTGDRHRHITQVVDAVSTIADTGVRYVKVALQPAFECIDVCQALAPMCQQGVKVILVVFADAENVRSQLSTFTMTATDSGLHGIMLDTANKSAGSLRHHLSDDELAAFIQQATECRLLTGLAGSLSIDDIPPLVAVAPDYLGFRGALCDQAQRTNALDARAMARVRAVLSSHQNTTRPPDVAHQSIATGGS